MRNACVRAIVGMCAFGDVLAVAQTPSRHHYTIQDLGVDIRWTDEYRLEMSIVDDGTVVASAGVRMNELGPGKGFAWRDGRFLTLPGLVAHDVSPLVVGANGIIAGSAGTAERISIPPGLLMNSMPPPRTRAVL